MSNAPAFDPIRPVDVPPAPAPRVAPKGFAAISGQYRRGDYCERPGRLGTFVKDARQIERVTHWRHGDDAFTGLAPMIGVSITRNRWETWSGLLTPAQFDALRSHCPNAEYRTLAQACGSGAGA